MSGSDTHGAWLSLLDVSGPFLAEPVLKEEFPQGLEGLDPSVKKEVRQAYDEWREALDFGDPELQKLHDAWVSFVLGRVLGFETGHLLSGKAAADRFGHTVPENGITIAADMALTDGKPDGRAFLLIASYAPQTPLDEAVIKDGWAATPIERMIELCRATGVRLGIVTNGERWTLVDAPVGAVVSIASWYARLWSQEPTTLQAFGDLLSIRRFFGAPEGELTKLLDKSLTLQDEVTDALGEQVRRAVEVLVQALDRADQDRNRELLKDVSPEELYEAGLTLMMRIVFLLSAEERGLLLLGDPQYEANYAVSTLRSQLRLQHDEVLERRWDAWSRLLALFRVVFAGVEHDMMRMPALGGSLFDPDRFPFLEGRLKRGTWKTAPAVPLPIDNRTVLLLLEAVQLFQGRTLSYWALDVEQIGYVYEGLLERTVVRAKESTLDLIATKSALHPWVTLAELDDAASDGREAVEELLKERTGSSVSRIRNDLARKVDEAETARLLAACHADVVLRDRLKPYFHLLRTDSWGYPLFYPQGTFMVASGSDRRETGTHYTPKSFTEAIVKTTLEPLVYVGPAEGAPPERWRLKPSEALLSLKVCDPAMGSGAFLVQVCRYLGDRVVDAWAEAVKSGKSVTSDGDVKDEVGTSEPITQNLEERTLVARRLVAERCLYGVDLNPLAVELAKLSIWLVTLAKGRPFGFLDHNLRSGDSLLGISSLEQLSYLDLAVGERSARKLFAPEIDRSVAGAISIRKLLRQRPIRDIADVDAMMHLDQEARTKVEFLTVVADALVGAIFDAGGRQIDTALLAIDVGEVLAGNRVKLDELTRRTEKALNKDLPRGRASRRPFHWPLEFPEVFSDEGRGFDAIVGNPPFLGDTRMKKALGGSYRKYITRFISGGMKGKADLVVFFFLRSFRMLKSEGILGLLARDTLSLGDSREIGLQQIIASGGAVVHAKTRRKWPGKASVIVHQVHISRSAWGGSFVLDGETVPYISPQLQSTESWKPHALVSNLELVFKGTEPNGDGFLISADQAHAWLRNCKGYEDILLPYIIARQVTQSPSQDTDRWIINFWDWSEKRSAAYELAYKLIERTVKPVRQRRDADGNFILRSPIPQKWWQHKEKRPALYHAIGRGRLFESHPSGWRQKKQLAQVLVVPRGATKYPVFTLLDNTQIFGDSLCVIANANYATFGVLSSDIHGIWAWQQGGRKKFDLSYTQESIFETFPFPDGVLEDRSQDIASCGKALFEGRKTYMVDHEKSMTDFYNDLHDQSLQFDRIREMRNVQVALNESVTAAYNFGDVALAHDFHEVGYLPAGQNVRFTIAETARTELLNHLALLNKSRYEQQDATMNTPRSRSSEEGVDEGSHLDRDLFNQDME